MRTPPWVRDIPAKFLGDPKFLPWKPKEDGTNFLTTTPSRGRPSPKNTTRRSPDPKSYNLYVFFLHELKEMEDRSSLIIVALTLVKVQTQSCHNASTFTKLSLRAGASSLSRATGRSAKMLRSSPPQINDARERPILRERHRGRQKEGGGAKPHEETPTEISFRPPSPRYVLPPPLFHFS